MVNMDDDNYFFTVMVLVCLVGGFLIGMVAFSKPDPTGDANRDGNVTMADVVCMEEFIAGNREAIDKQASDWNNNGRIDGLDIAITKAIIEYSKEK